MTMDWSGLPDKRVAAPMPDLNEQMRAELLPCPFCGTAPKMQNDGENGYWIECTNTACGSSTNMRIALMDDVKPLLVEQWNRRQHGSATQAVESNKQIAARWERMMLDQGLDTSDSQEPPKGWVGPVAAAISYRTSHSASSEFGPWEPTTLGHGCVIVLRGDEDKRVKFLYDAAPPVADAEAIEKLAQSWDGCMYDAPGETIDIGASIRAVLSRLNGEKNEQ